MPHLVQEPDHRTGPRLSRAIFGVEHEMTDATHDTHGLHDAGHGHGDGAPQTVWHHAWTRPGWYRVLWTTPLFFAIGCGLVTLIRWAAHWDPVWKGQPITTVALVTVPIGFLVGLGGFDFWTYYARWRADAG